MTQADKDIKNPLFQDVTISSQVKNVKTDAVTFCGLFNPFPMVANDRKKLYLGSSNTLYYPGEAMTINSFRAYFLLADGIIAGNPVHGEHRVKAFLLNFNGLQSVGIIDATSSDYEDSVNDKWFTIDGRKRSGKPNQKGVYIHNGRCVIGLP